ncbi:MAG: Omp28-related outer membrane protein [Bacteroidota bacterium]
MKKFNFTTLFVCSCLVLFGQSEAKKYVLLEHYTNTLCTICGSRNPAFYNTVDNYPGQTHHIAYHPPAPYTGCIFYRHNTVENSERTAFYNVFGTPTIVMDGTMVPGGSQLLPASTLEAQLGQTSPIEVIVEETTGQDRQVDITVRTLGDAPTGNLRLFAAIVEKDVLYNAPNGEDVHHDVFRRMLSDIDGDAFTAAATGEATTATYNYSIDNEWLAEEIYVVAFVQDIDSKEVLNSGTRFDERTTTSVRPEVLSDQLRVFPNPTVGMLQISMGDYRNQEVKLGVYDAAGRLVLSKIANGDGLELDVSALPKGLYVLKANVAEGILVQRFVRA